MNKKINQSDLPTATTKQFRNAVKSVLGGGHGGGWTDKPRWTKMSTSLRYVKMPYFRIEDDKIKSIEFILWAQGVTANTRLASFGIRGTCVLEETE
jgi:hypothetical protein